LLSNGYEKSRDCDLPCNWQSHGLTMVLLSILGAREQPSAGLRCLQTYAVTSGRGGVAPDEADGRIVAGGLEMAGPWPGRSGETGEGREAGGQMEAGPVRDDGRSGGGYTHAGSRMPRRWNGEVAQFRATKVAGP